VKSYLIVDDTRSVNSLYFFTFVLFNSSLDLCRISAVLSAKPLLFLMRSIMMDD